MDVDAPKPLTVGALLLPKSPRCPTTRLPETGINHAVLTVNVKYHLNPSQAQVPRTASHPAQVKLINRASKATDEELGTHKPPINRANMKLLFNGATET